MANTREIVTKAVIGKGKKTFTTTSNLKPEYNPSTILGCWVINHNFTGNKVDNKIVIDGSYDVNIWYSYDNDTKTDVVKDSNSYHEIVNVRAREDVDSQDEDIIVRSLKQPTCTKALVNDGTISYTIEKELGIELVSDVKMKIETNEEEDPWDEIVDEKEIDNEIDEEVKEDFIDDKENS